MAKKNQLDDHVRAYEGNLLYDFDNEIILKWYAKRIAESIKPEASLLELGLGYGYTSNIFSEIAKDHDVIEGSQLVIENFKKNFPDCPVNVIESFFETYETDKKYDLIVMGFILEHVDNPVQVLKHYKKFLNSGGGIFATVPNAEVMNRKLGNIMGVLPNMQVLSEHDHVLGHKRYYTMDSFKDDAKKAGYEVSRIEGIYLKPLTTKQLISLNLDQSVIDALCVLGVEYPELCCAMMAELKLPNGQTD